MLLGLGLKGQKKEEKRISPHPFPGQSSVRKPRKAGGGRKGKRHRVGGGGRKAREVVLEASLEQKRPKSEPQVISRVQADPLVNQGLQKLIKTQCPLKSPSRTLPSLPGG